MKCKHCGKLEADHCVYEAQMPMPPGCVCDPGEWNTDEVPEPCEEYQGDGIRSCQRCEHDRACHRGKGT